MTHVPDALRTRIDLLERQVRTLRMTATVVAVVAVLAAVAPRSQAQQGADAMRVRQLVVEDADWVLSGYDIVYSSVENSSIQVGVEALWLTGSAVTANGSASDDRLVGNDLDVAADIDMGRVTRPQRAHRRLVALYGALDGECLGFH